MSAGPPSGEADAVLRLQLYVAGDAPNSVAATANLRSVLARFPRREVELRIFDVIADPETGVSAGVLVTPMLLKLTPPPERRLLGNLKDLDTVMAALGLEQADE
jgi:circadian clock protein KaiB